jgi:hypothetical protein
MRKNLTHAVVSSLGMKHAQQRLIHMGDAPRGVQRKHAGRNAFEDGFHLPATLVEFGVGRAQVVAGGFNLPPGAFQVFGHAVKGAHQVANFIGGANVDAIVEASARDFLRGLGEGGQWTSHNLREE